MQENFAITDMAPGQYSVSVSTTKLYQQSVTVKPGELAFVTFVVKAPGPRGTAGPVTETPEGSVVTKATPTPEIFLTP